jgi:hypothetical protein
MTPSVMDAKQAIHSTGTTDIATPPHAGSAEEPHGTVDSTPPAPLRADGRPDRRTGPSDDNTPSSGTDETGSTPRHWAPMAAAALAGIAMGRHWCRPASTHERSRAGVDAELDPAGADAATVISAHAARDLQSPRGSWAEPTAVIGRGRRHAGGGPLAESAIGRDAVPPECGASGWALSRACTDGNDTAICPVCSRRVETRPGPNPRLPVRIVVDHAP